MLPAANVPPVAGVVEQAGSRQVCHTRGCKTKSFNGCGLVEAAAKKGCLDGRNRGGTAEGSSPYWLVSGGIECHDGGIRLRVRMNAGRMLVNEELRGE